MDYLLMQDANLNSVQSERSDARLRPVPQSEMPRPTLSATSKARVRRQLTPAKIGVAWEKLRRVVRDLCRQRGQDCPHCSLYGGRIEFQVSPDHQPVVLDLEGDRILAKIGSKRRTIRIVRIKTGGSGYELRRKIHTATLMLIELLLEARH